MSTIGTLSNTWTFDGLKISHRSVWRIVLENLVDALAAHRHRHLARTWTAHSAARRRAANPGGATTGGSSSRSLCRDAQSPG